MATAAAAAVAATAAALWYMAAAAAVWGMGAAALGYMVAENTRDKEN